MAMTLPTSVTASDSVRRQVERRRRLYVESQGHGPPERATRATSSSSKHRSRSVGNPSIADVGDCRCFFGWRSDPFFFDADGLFNNMQFTGADFFADQDVCSIVLELPNSALADKRVGLWARTLDRHGEGWIQADRGGRPLQAVFLAGADREAYLGGQPADDARFVGVFAHELEHAGGYTHEDAIRAARSLLPDILSYDPRSPAAYPHNGRTLTDDVVDVFFSMLTNGRVTGDKVGPHHDLLDVFPYLGPPHN